LSNTGFLAGKYILINTATKNLKLFQGRREVKSYLLQTGKIIPSIGQYKVMSKTYKPTGNNELKLSSIDGSLSLPIYGRDLSGTGWVLRGRGLLWLANNDLDELLTLVSIGTPVAIIAEKPVPELRQSPVEELTPEWEHPIEQHIREQPINESLDIEPLPELPSEPTFDEIYTEETPPESIAEVCQPQEQAEQLTETEQSVEKEMPPQDIAIESNDLPPAGFYYTVAPGDSLWRIARRFNLPMQLIMKHNSLDNPNRIFPGQKIFIPYHNQLNL
jgi:LysM repeat protein